MIEIDYHLLSELAIENLIMAILTREATDYGEEEMGFAQKKTTASYKT
ncbi:TPA: YheU family protein [Legionella feeleii]